jgi:hypothetical protein
MDNFIEYGLSKRDANSELTINFKGMNLDPNAKNYSNCDVAGSFYEVEYNTGSFTAIGYEQDEKIVYVLVEPMTKDDILKCESLKSRSLPKANYFNYFCPADRYFDSTRFSSEDTGYRVLFKLDGSALLRSKFGEMTKLSLSLSR